MIEVWVSISQKNFGDIRSLKKLIEFDISKLRINLGRDSYEFARSAISNLLELGWKNDSVILDVNDQKIRIQFPNAPDNTILRKGERLLFARNSSVKNDSSIVGIISKGLFFELVARDDIIYLGDGDVQLVVEEATKALVVCKALNEGPLEKGKSVSIEGKELNRFKISNQELDKINNLLDDFHSNLLVSFVESEKDLEWCKNMCPKASNIIPKLETKLALQNMYSILANTNIGVLGRGDLGLSVGVERIGLIQAKVIEIAKHMRKKIIIATEILESMRFRNVPFRSKYVT